MMEAEVRRARTFFDPQDTETRDQAPNQSPMTPTRRSRPLLEVMSDIEWTSPTVLVRAAKEGMRGNHGRLGVRY